MGGGMYYVKRRNRKAVVEAMPEKRGVVDDWNDLLKEEKMIAKERETGRCARCDQPLPEARRRGINGLSVDRFGFRVISL